MRRLLGLAAVILLLSSLLLIARVPASDDPGLAAPDTQVPSGLSRQDRRERLAEEFNREHMDSSGRVRPDLWLKGIEHVRQMSIAAGVPLGPQASGRFGLEGVGGVIGVQWTQIGPAPLRIDNEQNFQGQGPDSGEVTDIAIDPRNTTDRTIYIATNSGGIWKTTDGGTTWKPKTDFMPSNSMGAVGLDPGNPSIVYAGSGNLFAGSSIFFKAAGLYKSLDGGDTWSVLGTNVFTSNIGINRIVLPAPGVLLVGTGTGARCGSGSGSGLYRSVDGGLSFGSNSPLFNNGQPILTGCIFDLDLDTANPSTTVYASVQGQGIFVSTDGGVTFPTNLFNNTGAPTGTYGYIAFSQSTMPDNQTMYASVQDPSASPSYKGLFKSTNAGGSWTTMADAANRAAENNGCQCGYDLTVGVDPQDADRVYIGFQELYRSTDGGANFGTPAVSRNKIHWDHHALVFSPSSHWGGGGAPTRFYAGEDGGIATSADGGGSFANINEGIATNLFLSIDIGRGTNPAQASGFTYGGTQDTGIIEHNPISHTGLDWHLARDGDGGVTSVDPCDATHAISTDNGRFVMTTNGGGSWPLDGHGFTSAGGLGALMFDPACNNAYVGLNGNDLWQSTDNAGNFASIHVFGGGKNIRAMAMAKIDSNTMWVGFDDGTVEKTSNLLSGGASTWTSHTVTGAPAGQPVSDLAVDPTNTDVVVVVYPGFTSINPMNRTKHVFRTIDGGSTWTDISGTDGGNVFANLPDLPLHSVVIDPGTSPHSIMVASDDGVMRTANNGATWQVLGVGLPTVDCKALEIDPEVTPSLLRVGTHGRSVFELTAATGPLLAVNADLGFGPVCVGDSATRIVQIFNVGSEDLHISSFIRVSGSADFEIISGPATPVTVLPGEEIDYTVRFRPSSAGDKTAVLQINSDDPFRPAFSLPASGTGTVARIATLIADAGSFGDVCLDTFKDLDLTMSNSGSCDLSVTNITSSSAQFKVAGTMSFPLVIAPGGALAVPIRFEPTSLGAKSADLTVNSSDPVTPVKVVHVTGNVPAPDVRVTGSTDFGDVCAGTLAEKTLSVCNVGPCDLHVTSVAFEPPCNDFTLINNPFPATVSPDSCESVVIRFTPTSVGPKSCTLVIRTDDPDTPVISKTVTGNTPVPMIDVPPDLGFPPTVLSSVGACSTPEPFPVSNTGTCPLSISGFAITAGAEEYSIAALPSFPIILEPGHEAGEGDLSLDFAPDVLGRARAGTVKVTYVSDSITGATTDVTRALCGEGVRTGARVLVTAGGIPLASVEQIKLVRINANRNRTLLDTVDTARNLTLQTVVPGAPCGSFQYHREYGTVSNPIQLLPGSYQVTVTAIVNGRRTRKTVGFDVTTCGFNPAIIVNF
jgi:hypothetical protein